MFAFMHIRKTGGLTMRALLRKNFGIKNCDCPINDVIRPEDWDWVKKCYPNLQSIQGHSVRLTPEFDLAFPEARFFTIIRDPFKRSLSQFQHSNHHRSVLPVLKDWIPHRRNELCRAICGEANSQHAIDVMESRIGFVGLTGKFNESMLLWRSWTGLPNLSLTYKPKNVAKSSDVKQQILSDSNMVEIFKEANQEDQKLYKYVVQNIYSRQQSNYGNSLSADLEVYEQELASASNLSFQALMGCAKRHLLYKRGLRDWKAELSDDEKQVA